MKSWYKTLQKEDKKVSKNNKRGIRNGYFKRRKKHKPDIYA